MTPLPLEAFAEVEVTSEAADAPIEAALSGGQGSGWRAGSPGEQRVALLFARPERVRRIDLEFVEEGRARTHEFLLTWSGQNSSSPNMIVRQQWTFSPSGSTTESETYNVSLEGVQRLDLTIRPDLSDGTAVATIREWRVYG